MLLAKGKNDWPTTVGGLAIAVSFAAVALFLGIRMVDDMVETSARHRASTFADYLTTDSARLGSLTSPLTRDPEAENRIRTMAGLSHIVAFSVFDLAGQEIYTTQDRQGRWSLREAPGYATAGPRLAEHALQRSGEWQEVVTSDRSNPTMIMPLTQDGRTTAFLSVELDMAPERSGYAVTLAWAAGQLLLLILLAAGIPAFIYVRRKRRIQEADERIQFLHNHDALTKCLNRRRMNEETDRVLATARATRERMAVWFLDIDGLAVINDTMDQAFGDELLRITAGRLAEVLDRKDLISRIGSDDFAILQRNVQGEESLKALAHRIHSAMSVPIELGDRTVTQRVTLGAALAPDHGRTYAELVKYAEIAFQHQKSLRRGEYALFQTRMDEEVHRRRTIERMLPAAIENDGFELFYQPIVSGACGSLIGFEALLRLPDGNGSYVPPVDFIPIAEARGHIKEIGSWVIRQAALQAAKWPDHLFVSVNLSAVQFRDGDLIGIVSAALHDAGIEGRRLGIEVVESLLLDQSDEVLEQLRALRALGISIDMDDFGTGYSSLGYLWRFPFDKLKIDQSFLHALRAGQPSASRIVETIVSLAHHLGLKVTAEGIETPEQAELLRSFGCDQLQGYYFGKPQPPAELSGTILRGVTPSNILLYENRNSLVSGH